MTESELCGSSFDWEGGSPSVFLRPMNPALSAQQYFPDESPSVWGAKDSFRRTGAYMTPASPLFGSISYMSQESSCCSALNNAIIMEDDDNETIPTDERPSMIPVLVDDVSPIVDKSFNVSDFPAGNESSSLPPVEEKSNASTLQELLYEAPAKVDIAFIGNSPGPQWSPGIRGDGPLLKSPNLPLIRIENFLDASPSLSPKRGDIAGADSSLSISAIIPAMHSSPVDNEPEERRPLTATHHDVKKRLEPPQVIVSPVHRFTHRRASPLAIERISPTLPEPSSFIQRRRASSPLGMEAYRRASPLGIDDRGSSSLYLQRQTLSARRTVLSTEERELKEAEDGRRRVMSQIRHNRRQFEVLKDASFNVSRFQRPIVTSSSTLGAVDRLRSRIATNTSSSLIGRDRSSCCSVLRGNSLERSLGPVRIEIKSQPATCMVSVLGARPSLPARSSIYTAHRRPATATVARPAWR